MTGPFFVDTNVLVYADDRSSGPKQALAQDLIRSAFRSAFGTVSTQVLAELFAVATRKLGLPAKSVRRRVEIYSSLRVHRLAPDDLLAAIDLHRLHELSIWDALIVRSALVTGCRVLYTEDLQHGQTFDGLRIVNPFTEPTARP
ncbi:MAG: PIN domain-containing protein [Acidobacteria bacterium]|nr:PIN domain-containing protein [Acidobacteriota bacterium]